MEKSESIKQITEAIIKVMADVKGIEKNLTVGTGASSYKGVADQDVKKIIGESMEKNGLAILPVDVVGSSKVESWDETGQYGTKRKQSVLTEVITTYLLTHISGEYITLKGFGHGVDSQDKSAGKATTYALKYTLLYTFLVPTGKIDDADNTHSEEIKTPVKEIKREALTPTHPNWNKVVAHLKGKGTMSEILIKYTLDKTSETKLMDAVMESVTINE